MRIWLTDACEDFARAMPQTYCFDPNHDPLNNHNRVEQGRGLSKLMEPSSTGFRNTHFAQMAQQTVEVPFI